MNGLTRATAVILTDARGWVLLVPQNRAQRRWGLPGGDLRDDEPPDTALVRDITRETGLNTLVVDLVGLYHLSGGDEGLPDLLTYVFRGEIVTRTPWPHDTASVRRRLGWHSPRHVPTPATVTTCAALTDAAAGRSGLMRHLRR